ncbi:MAG: DUF4976 domain-containing protein, partial [Draconibacterium sp.]|nr:DUF4976 domain-containing protein [Draconibacterium sp.]
YPNKIGKGTSSDLLVQNLDIAPTFLDIAGVKIPDEMQGNSLRETWKTKSPEWRNAIYYHFYEKGWGVPMHYGIRTERYKLIHFYDEIDSWELYDLKEDPSEMNNLIDNLEYSEIIENMKITLTDLQEKYKDNFLN